MKELMNKMKMEVPFHIVKRDNIVRWKSYLIRIVAGVLALLVCAILNAIVTKDFGGFFQSLFTGIFGTERRIWLFLQNTAMLLCVALAVTPAFKMKFWNIGAEGQVLMGGLACAACMKMIGDKIPNGALIIVMLICSIGAGMIWAVIPAIFKAKWGTNETLFTLMMNYVAMHFVMFCVYSWDKSNRGNLGILPDGHLPSIAGQQYLINIIIVTIVTLLVFVYLRFSKHGYELSVVGESVNTAKYIGINVKKVIVRTMLVSGAICGISGFLLVAGTGHTIATSTAGGRGFTAIMVSWLAHFNPLSMVLTSFLVVFFQQGAGQIVTDFRLGNNAYADIITGLFFFFIIGCEFFLNYRIVFTKPLKKHKQIGEAEDPDIPEDHGAVDNSNEPLATENTDDSSVSEKISDLNNVICTDTAKAEEVSE